MNEELFDYICVNCGILENQEMKDAIRRLVNEEVRKARVEEVQLLKQILEPNEYPNMKVAKNAKIIISKEFINNWISLRLKELEGKE